LFRPGFDGIPGNVVTINMATVAALEMVLWCALPRPLNTMAAGPHPRTRHEHWRDPSDMIQGLFSADELVLSFIHMLPGRATHPYLEHQVTG
jgi:hypothetical protein